MSLDVKNFLVDDFLCKYEKLVSSRSSIDRNLRKLFRMYYDLLKDIDIGCLHGADPDIPENIDIGILQGAKPDIPDNIDSVIPQGAKQHALDKTPDISDVLYFLNHVMDDCLVESAESLRSMAKRRFKRCRQIKYEDIATLVNNLGHLQTTISRQRGSSATAPHKPASIPLLNYTVHGFEDQFNEILRKITTSFDQGTSKPNMRAVGIVGICGSGKTTLTSMLFNSREVREKYPIMIWASLTCTLNKKESTRGSVFMEILNGVQNDSLKTMLQKIKYLQGGSKMPDHVLDKYIKHFKLVLQRNRGKYLIVLDDVWETDYWFAENEDPKDGENEPPKDEEPKSMCVLSREWIRKTGGTVLVTSRLEEMVDNIVGMSNLHMIRPVSNVECFNIFLDRATRDGYFEREDEELQNIKEYILNQCFGLPLLAITVADIVIAEHREEAAKKEMEAAELKAEAEREAEVAKSKEAESEAEAAKIEEEAERKAH